MSTETTNKKIKIDNGTTFGRTYTDKAVDELLKNVGGGTPILDMLPYYDANTQTISQEGLNLLQQKYINNEIVGVSFGAEATCMILDTMGETGLVFVGPYQVGLGSFKVSINMESRAVANEWEKKTNNLVLPATSPTSQLIPSITTSNTQQNLTIGDGLAIENGALKTIIPTLPSDASSKTYTLQTVNGTLAWTDAIGDINTILDNINGEVI